MATAVSYLLSILCPGTDAHMLPGYQNLKCTVSTMESQQFNLQANN